VAGKSFAKIAKEFRALPRTDKSVADLFRDALALAKDTVPFDGWGALTLDPATLLVTSGVHEHGFSASALDRWFELEVNDGDFLHYPGLARELTPVGRLSDATRGELSKSPRYREVLSGAGYSHELRVALRSMKQTWGGLFLLRRHNAPNFEPEEESFLRELGDALGDGIRATLRAANAATDARTGRAILLLGEKHEILAASPSASVWLEELADGPLGSLPHTVRSTVNGARRGAERGTQVSAYVRVRGKSGNWLTVHASLLGDGKVVVTIEEGRPIALAVPLREAYGLTPLQGDVLRDILLGIDDVQIAERTNLPAANVHGELQEILKKVGVQRRFEFAKKLFFDHYAERLRAGTPLGADGWFAD
jgi:DNA-binding CsgD family transcriptional regulator